MRVTQMLIGDTPGSMFARSLGVVQMNGGLLEVLAQLSVGDGIGCTGIVRMVGGEIRAIDQGTNVNRIGDLGRGEVTVSNALFNIGNLSVARHDGSVGVLTLQENGIYLASDDLNIGRFSGATGLVHLAGGTLALSNNPVWIGREGNGRLVVSNGLLVSEGLYVAAQSTNTSSGLLTLAGGVSVLSSNLLIGDGIFQNGSVEMNGGLLFITNRGGVANLNLQSGTMKLSGGTATVDTIIVTNALSAFSFNGGTLRSRQTVVDNGAPFTVGDGISRAEFTLDGGTHSFANGLIISPNAIVSGCGVIIGGIVNNGTLSVTNCGSTGVALSISQPPVSLTTTQGATLTFNVVASGDAPLAYQWRRGTADSGSDIPGATTATLTISNAQSADAGPYYVVVSNSSGSVTSSVAMLRVLVPTEVQASLIGSELVFGFSTTSNLDYTVEFKNTLDDASWTPLETIPGTGGFLSVTNFTTNSATRFFRLRVD
jgi:T5SS/PEP-CTERM-associated repeat protein